MGCSKPQSWYFTTSLSVMLLGERSEGAAALCASSSQSRAGSGQDQVLHIDWGLQLGVCLGDGMKTWSQQAAEKRDYIGSRARRARLI